MVIGICKMTLVIYGAISLKDKRRVVKSLIERLKSRFNISIAEVGDNDIQNKAMLGVSCVSNDAAHADSMLSAVIDFVENDPRVNLIDYTTEIIHI